MKKGAGRHAEDVMDGREIRRRRRIPKGGRESRWRHMLEEGLSREMETDAVKEARGMQR